jgi:hypothetical protein
MPGNAFEQQALAMAVQQRAWGSILIPIYDLRNKIQYGQQTRFTTAQKDCVLQRVGAPRKSFVILDL